MKDKEKLFAVLRSAVESPRESAIVEEFIQKIDHIMPPIETIDDTHKKFNGIVYRKDCKIGRYTTEIPLHRAVWHYFNGEIPSGCNIHHIDFDKNNDDISNLTMLTYSEHWKIHAPINGAGHRTKMTTFVCDACGKEYEAVNTGNNRYCSAYCRNKYRSTVKNQGTFICQYCGKEFQAYKYNKSRVRKFCSVDCSHQYRQEQNRLFHRPQTSSDAPIKPASSEK